MLETLYATNPAEFVRVVELALGSRLRSLRRDEDRLQTFWLGVVEALPRMEPDRDETHFLIAQGYGAVRNLKRAENTKRFFKFCGRCGREYAYRVIVCKECGQELDIDLRDTTADNLYVEIHNSEHDIMIEQFLATLEDGTRKYVAKRWLKDRADLFYANHSKQIAFELGISAPAVAVHKKHIREAFLRFYHG